jgi:hypothetical protein
MWGSALLVTPALVEGTFSFVLLLASVLDFAS